MDDHEQIRRLVALYSQLIDDARWTEWADLFTDDAVFTVWGTAYTGRAAIREGISGMMPEHPGKHVAFASVIDVDGDRATGWTDFISVADDGAGQWGRSYVIATAARYYDRFVRDDGRWRIARRDLRMAGAPLPDEAQESPAV